MIRIIPYFSDITRALGSVFFIASIAVFSNVNGIRITSDIGEGAALNTYKVKYRYKSDEELKEIEFSLLEAIDIFEKPEITSESTVESSNKPIDSVVENKSLLDLVIGIFDDPTETEKTTETRAIRYGSIWNGTPLSLGKVAMLPNGKVEGYTAQSHWLSIPLILNEFRGAFIDHEDDHEWGDYIHSFDRLISVGGNHYYMPVPERNGKSGKSVSIEQNNHHTPLGERDWQLKFKITENNDQGARIDWHQNLGFTNFFRITKGCNGKGYSIECNHNAGHILLDESSRVKEIEIHFASPLYPLHPKEEAFHITKECVLTIKLVEHVEAPTHFPIKDPLLFSKIVSPLCENIRKSGLNNDAIKGKAQLKIALGNYLSRHHMEWDRPTFSKELKRLRAPSNLAQIARRYKLEQYMDPVYNADDHSLAEALHVMIGRIIAEVGEEIANEFIINVYGPILYEAPSTQINSFTIIDREWILTRGNRDTLSAYYEIEGQQHCVDKIETKPDTDLHLCHLSSFIKDKELIPRDRGQDSSDLNEEDHRWIDCTLISWALQ